MLTRPSASTRASPAPLNRLVRSRLGPRAPFEPLRAVLASQQHVPREERCRSSDPRKPVRSGRLLGCACKTGDERDAEKAGRMKDRTRRDRQITVVVYPGVSGLELVATTSVLNGLGLGTGFRTTTV